MKRGHLSRLSGQEVILLAILLVGIPTLTTATEPGSSTAASNSSAPPPAGDVQDAPTQYAIASRLLTQNSETDYAQGLEWLSRAAKQNHAPALFDLANLYENGLYVQQDMAKALELYEQAAKQGYLDAQYNLGILYLKRPRNYAKAQFWLQQAANQNDRDAQYNLALLYDVEDTDKKANPSEKIG